MVGPCSAVADCAVTLADYEGYSGEASRWENVPAAIENAAAASRVAIAEALRNLAAADVDSPGSSGPPLDGRLRTCAGQDAAL